MNTGYSHQVLHETVIAKGYCVGCGVCAVPDESPFKIVLNEHGQFQADPVASLAVDTTTADYEKLCPFGARATSEDIIAKDLYAAQCEYNSQVGYHNGVFAGYVSEGKFRDNGSSGGMATWVLNELLAQGLVDQIIHVRPGARADGADNMLFSYAISDTVEAIQKGAKSRYYPIELSQVLRAVRAQPGRYAIVGLPCFIKSVRLLQRQDPILAERIRYCVGLVCGHLKSSRYAESLAWQMGVKPSSLRAIDFRVKDPARPANRYSTAVTAEDGQTHTAHTSELFGTDWGAGVFRYKACDFCDDVFAETADIVVGDAWLPEYVQDSSGTNIVITRTAVLQELVTNARGKARLRLDDLPVAKAAQSQDAGLRHRKGAISYRLFLASRWDNWTPVKRVSPSRRLSPSYERKKQVLRIELRDLSHKAFLLALIKSDLDSYIKPVKQLYDKYRKSRVPFWKRLLGSLKRRVSGFLERIKSQRFFT